MLVFSNRYFKPNIKLLKDCGETRKIQSTGHLHFFVYVEDPFQ